MAVQHVAQDHVQTANTFSAAHSVPFFFNSEDNMWHSLCKRNYYSWPQCMGLTKFDSPNLLYFVFYSSLRLSYYFICLFIFIFSIYIPPFLAQRPLQGGLQINIFPYHCWNINNWLWLINWNESLGSCYSLSKLPFCGLQRDLSCTPPAINQQI